MVGKQRAVTIPVNVSIEGKHRVLVMSELEEIFKNAGVLYQEECGCRMDMGNCIEPMDGCISVMDAPDEEYEKRGGKQVTVEEAMQAMERTHKAGLVHMAYTFKGKEKPEQICSCCSCCCHSLGGARKFGYSDHVFESKFIAKDDMSRCSHCGLCVDICQLEAREMVDEKMIFHHGRCFGCGVCLDACPEDAISMINR